MQVCEVSLIRSRRGAAKYITGVPHGLFLNELKHCPDSLVAAERQFQQHNQSAGCRLLNADFGDLLFSALLKKCPIWASVETQAQGWLKLV